MVYKEIKKDYKEIKKDFFTVRLHKPM